MKSLLVFFIWISGVHICSTFRLDTPGITLEKPEFLTHFLPEAAQIDHSLVKRNVLDYVNKLYHDVSKYDDDDSLIETIDSHSQDLFNINVLHGERVSEDTVAFPLEGYHKSQKITYVELVTTSQRRNSSTNGEDSKETEKNDEYIEEDVTEDFKQTCGQSSDTCVYEVSSADTEHLYLVIFKNMNKTLISSLRSRQKREATNPVNETNDQSQSSSLCSLKPWAVNFEDIGFHKWIFFPEFYTLNLCSGQCSNRNVESFTNHAVTKMYFKAALTESVAEPAGLCVHCAPSSYRPLTLTFFDHHGNFLVRQVPKLRVEACGCV